MKTLEYHKSNLFIVILGISAALIFLGILVLNVFQKQGLQGRAYQSLGCNSDRECPESTVCKGGVCILNSARPTQAPLSYVSVSSVVEKQLPIPAVYDRPTPLPRVNLLEQISKGVNSTVVNIFDAIVNLLGRFGLKGL